MGAFVYQNVSSYIAKYTHTFLYKNGNKESYRMYEYQMNHNAAIILLKDDDSIITVNMNPRKDKQEETINIPVPMSPAHLYFIEWQGFI
jgi:hypothetical protein